MVLNHLGAARVRTKTTSRSNSMNKRIFEHINGSRIAICWFGHGVQSTLLSTICSLVWKALIERRHAEAVEKLVGRYQRTFEQLIFVRTLSLDHMSDRSSDFFFTSIATCGMWNRPELASDLFGSSEFEFSAPKHMCGVRSSDAANQTIYLVMTIYMWVKEANWVRLGETNWVRRTEGRELYRTTWDRMWLNETESTSDRPHRTDRIGLSYESQVHIWISAAFHAVATLFFIHTSGGDWASGRARGESCIRASVCATGSVFRRLCFGVCAVASVPYVCIPATIPRRLYPGICIPALCRSMSTAATNVMIAHCTMHGP